MDLSKVFRTIDELTEYCLLPDNATQDAALAEKVKELTRQGVTVPGMQCNLPAPEKR